MKGFYFWKYTLATLMMLALLTIAAKANAKDDTFNINIFGMKLSVNKPAQDCVSDIENGYEIRNEGYTVWVRFFQASDEALQHMLAAECETMKQLRPENGTNVHSITPFIHTDVWMKNVQWSGVRYEAKTGLMNGQEQLYINNLIYLRFADGYATISLLGDPSLREEMVNYVDEQCIDVGASQFPNMLEDMQPIDMRGDDGVAWMKKASAIMEGIDPILNNQLKTCIATSYAMYRSMLGTNAPSYNGEDNTLPKKTREWIDLTYEQLRYRRGLGPLNEVSPMPQSESIRCGKLKNGMTYYIDASGSEEKSEFGILARVGSMQESEDQRGLAHFLEHMCFNGSTHFPSTALFDYTESKGASFAAQTNIQNTSYVISGYPNLTENPGARDSMFLILHDLADGLELSDKEIDNERRIILEEIRIRKHAMEHMRTKSLRTEYEGHPMANSDPLGPPEFIKSFPYQALRDYYDKWYNPENQAIFIVCNDATLADKLEQQIREMFSDIKPSRNAGNVVNPPVPINPKPLFFSMQDMEEKTSQIVYYHKTQPVPYGILRNTIGFRKRLVIEDIIKHMVTARLAKGAKRDNASYNEAEFQFGPMYGQNNSLAANLTIKPIPNRSEEALTQALTILRQASIGGFTKEELDMGKEKALSEHRLNYLNEFCLLNSGHRNIICDDFFYGEGCFNLGTIGRISYRLTENITLDEVNDYARQWLFGNESGSGDIICGYFGRREAQPLSEAQLASILHNVCCNNVQVSSDTQERKADDDFDVSQLKPGEVTETGEWTYGTMITLNNGMRVAYLPIEGGGKVNIRTMWVGGESLLEKISDTPLPKRVAAYKAFEEFTGMTLGKTVLTHSVTENYDKLEEAFQKVTRAILTHQLDEKAIAEHLRKLNEEAADTIMTPTDVINDKGLLIGRSGVYRRWDSPITTTDMEALDVQEVFRELELLTADAGRCITLVSGTINPDSIPVLAARYFGCLPGTSASAWDATIAETPLLERQMEKSDLHFYFRASYPQTMYGASYLSDQMPTTMENVARAKIAGAVLYKLLFDYLREELGVCYALSATGYVDISAFKDASSLWGVQCFIPTGPEHMEVVEAATDSILRSMADGIDPRIFQIGVEQTLAENITHDAEGFNQKFEDIFLFGCDWVNTYPNLVVQQTAEDVSAFVRSLLSTCRKHTFSINPQ